MGVPKNLNLYLSGNTSSHWRERQARALNNLSQDPQFYGPKDATPASEQGMIDVTPTISPTTDREE